MVQGVALQTYHRRKLVSEEAYLKINYLKSGSLFEAAAVIGGLVGSCSSEDSDTLADFGRNFGNAYQIRDDVSGVYAEEEGDHLYRSDILNGDVTLPFVYALESESITDVERDFLMRAYRGDVRKAEIGEVRRIYEETGALERSIDKMKEFSEGGRGKLDRFERTEARDCLDRLLDQYYMGFIPGEKPKIAI